MARTVTYKGHQIRAHAVIRVPVPTGHRDQPRPDPDDRTFPTEEDAGGYAVHLATGWVDRHSV